MESPRRPADESQTGGLHGMLVAMYERMLESGEPLDAKTQANIIKLLRDNGIKCSAGDLTRMEGLRAKVNERMAGALTDENHEPRRKVIRLVQPGGDIAEPEAHQPQDRSPAG